MAVFMDEHGGQRLRDTEFVLPVVVGTVAFNLGKKATDAATHRWTVYLRGLNNEDLSYIISRVQFDLHETFQNSKRMVTQQPFEVTEHGWGEFTIIVHINFTPDAGENEVVLYHKLKLYEDGEQGAKQDPKKPVVSEIYEELVFSEPRQDFYNRVTQHRPVPLNPPSQLLPYFSSISEAADLESIRIARAYVAGKTAEVLRELTALGIAPPPQQQQLPQLQQHGHMGAMMGGMALPPLPPMPGF